MVKLTSQSVLTQVEFDGLNAAFHDPHYWNEKNVVGNESLIHTLYGPCIRVVKYTTTYRDLLPYRAIG